MGTSTGALLDDNTVWQQLKMHVRLKPAVLRSQTWEHVTAFGNIPGVVWIEHCLSWLIVGKWPSTEPEQGKFDFTSCNVVADFAREHNITFRGHNLCWVLLQHKTTQVLKLIHMLSAVVHSSTYEICFRFNIWDFSYLIELILGFLCYKHLQPFWN